MKNANKSCAGVELPGWKVYPRCYNHFASHNCILPDCLARTGVCGATEVYKWYRIVNPPPPSALYFTSVLNMGATEVQRTSLRCCSPSSWDLTFGEKKVPAVVKNAQKIVKSVMQALNLDLLCTSVCLHNRILVRMSKGNGRFYSPLFSKDFHFQLLRQYVQVQLRVQIYPLDNTKSLA
jgi:hypothetical protein